MQMAASQVAQIMDLCVGKEPTPLYKSQLLEFNEIFLEMFNAFGLNPKNRLVFAHFHNTGETGNLHHNTFAVRKVWKVLEYHQLVQVETVKELTGEVSEKTGKAKKRTLNIIQPTKLGYEVRKNGMILEVPLKFEEASLLIGIGYPYPTFKNEWRCLEAMFKVARIAKTRQEKWYYEFKKFYPENVAKRLQEDADRIVIDWGARHIATAPRRGRRLRQLAPAESVLNHKLEKWCLEKEVTKLDNL